jgi:hypothetical protein
VLGWYVPTKRVARGVQRHEVLRGVSNEIDKIASNATFATEEKKKKFQEIDSALSRAMHQWVLMNPAEEALFAFLVKSV